MTALFIDRIASNFIDDNYRRHCTPNRPRRADFRFHQRLSRRREFHCHRSFDARVVSTLRGYLGGDFQFHRICNLRNQGRENHWRRFGAHRSNPPGPASLRVMCGTHGSNYLEPGDLVSGLANFQLARSGGWLRGRGDRRVSGNQWLIEASRLDQDPDIYCRLSVDWFCFGLYHHARGLLDFSARHAVAGGQDISSRSVVVCCRLLTGPWRQRRAKNDGHRYGGARHGRSFQFAFGR